MYTVKEWRYIGVKFIVGDVITHIECEDETLDDIDCSILNGESVCDENLNARIKSFAPRKNTGAQPVPDGVMVDFKCQNDDQWIKGCSAYMTDWSRVTQWKPSLKQPLLESRIQTESPEEHEAFEAMEKKQSPYDVSADNPVFTQAMADAGELPPVGAKVLYTTTEYQEGKSSIEVGVWYHCTVIAYHNGFVWTSDNGLRGLHATKFKPIQSPREKAIDEMFTDAGVQGSNIAFVRLYKANYRKLTPEHAKMYDDKTDFFRRGL